MTRARHRPTVRTGHVAPLDSVGPQYIAHIEGNIRVLEDAPEPFDSIAAAVEWARARASIVVVRVAGEDFRHTTRDAHVMAEERVGEHVSAEDQIAQARAAGLASAEPAEAQRTIDGIEW